MRLALHHQQLRGGLIISGKRQSTVFFLRQMARQLKTHQSSMEDLPSLFLQHPSAELI
jgi:hypothetical protein